MNKRILLYTFVFVLLSLSAVSCNDDDEEEEGTTSVATYSSSSTAITGFNLVENNNILANLDSVFFTIDLNEARIYNADSLPKGTDISRMLINVSYPSCHSVTVSINNAERMRDTTFAYSNADTVDFTGDVKIKVTALDQVTTRTYDVKVNVHTLESDSLQWDEVAYSQLPSQYGKVADQKTVKFNDDAYCLMADNGYYILAIADAPTGTWTKQEVTLPFTPSVRTFTACDDAMYILSADNGELYTSTDAVNWTSCGVAWCGVTGAYGDRLLGLINDNGTYYHDEYPRRAGYSIVQADAAFPVAGTSNLVLYENKWGTSDIAVCIGGLTANGEYVGRAWGYDGNAWSILSNNEIAGREGMSLLLYTTVATADDSWNTTAYPTFIAWGGRTATGELDNTMYVSRDMGVHWSLADQLMQLPEYIPAVYRADALVFVSTMTDNAAKAGAMPGTLSWRSMPSPEMPVWFNATAAFAMVGTRSATAGNGITHVTEWDIPYIYMFGGQDEAGNTHNTVWRGVLNRLTYKPVY